MHKIRIQLPQDWLGHQHGGRFIVLGQRYDCPDSLFQNSQNLTVVIDCFKTNRRDLWVGQKKAVCSVLCNKTWFNSDVFFRPGRTKCFLNVFSDTLSSKRQQQLTNCSFPNAFLFSKLSISVFCALFNNLQWLKQWNYIKKVRPLNLLTLAVFAILFVSIIAFTVEATGQVFTDRVCWTSSWLAAFINIWVNGK